MSWWRKGLYLILIAPLHHFLSLIASMPAMLLLPPDLFAQLLLTLPLFAVAIWWAVPAFQQLMGLRASAQRIASIRLATLLCGFAPLGVAIVAVYLGIATLVEALILGAVILIACHAWLIRSF